ncbi:MAG: siderophore-interacting protein [Nakamurella sp.]
MARTIRAQRIHPISLRKLSVLDAHDVTIGMRRVILGGEELRAHERDGYDLPDFISDGFDDEIKIFLPHPVTGELTLPLQRNKYIDWPQDPWPISRTYTVRSFDRERGEIALDFVKHGTGAATTWATRCRPGDELHIAGPKMAYLQPAGVDWLLIAGDETALPSIGRWIEEMPSDTKAQVFIEVPGPSHEQTFKSDAGPEITWLHRGSREPGTTSLLLDALRAAPWWPGEVFAWVAGEALTLKPIRRYLRDDRALPAEHVEVTGYWRRTETAAIVDDPGIPDPEEEDDTWEKFHQLSDLLPPYAIRVAATLNLIPLISAGQTTLGQLVGVSGADPRALGKLLRYLVTIGLLEHSDDRAGPDQYSVTQLGSELDDEDAAALDLSTALGQLDLVFGGLLDTVRTGSASYPGIFGAPIDQHRDSDEAVDAGYREALTGELTWLAAAFGGEVPFARGAKVVAAGDGVLKLLNEPLRLDPALDVSLLSRPSRAAGGLSALEDDVADRVRVIHGSEFDGWPAAEVVLIANLLNQHPDDDAVHLLRQAAQSLVDDGAVLVVEKLLLTGDVAGIDEHEAGDDLRLLCIHGSGLRTRTEMLAMFDSADVEVAAEQIIGWGDTVFHLRPRVEL